MVRAEWNAPMISEMRNFPNGKHDDQIDAASRGFNHLSSGPPQTSWTPPISHHAPRGLPG